MSHSILITDDSTTMRKIIRRTLRQAGIEAQVHEAGDGRQALDVMAREEIDLLLTDLKMPVMSGLELIEALRADPANASLKIVAISTETSAPYAGAAVDSGADRFIAKPFTVDELSTELGSLLDEA